MAPAQTFQKFQKSTASHKLSCWGMVVFLHATEIFLTHTPVKTNLDILMNLFTTFMTCYIPQGNLKQQKTEVFKTFLHQTGS